MIQLFHVMCAVDSDDTKPLFWNYVVEDLKDVFACVIREITKYAGDTSSYDPVVIHELRCAAQVGDLDGLLELWNANSTLQIRYEQFSPETAPPLSEEEKWRFLNPGG